MILPPVPDLSLTQRHGQERSLLAMILTGAVRKGSKDRGAFFKAQTRQRDQALHEQSQSADGLQPRMPGGHVL